MTTEVIRQSVGFILSKRKARKEQPMQGVPEANMPRHGILQPNRSRLRR